MKIKKNSIAYPCVRSRAVTFYFPSFHSPDQGNHFSYSYLVFLKDSAVKRHFFESLVTDDTVLLSASHHLPLQIEPDFRYGFTHVRLVQRRGYQLFLQFFNTLQNIILTSKWFTSYKNCLLFRTGFVWEKASANTLKAFKLLKFGPTTKWITKCFDQYYCNTFYNR